MERVRAWFATLGESLMTSSPPGESQESILRSSVAWLASKPELTLRTDEVRTYLRNLAPERLFDADEWLRAYTSPLYGKWKKEDFHHLLSSRLDPLTRQSLLFLSAGHPDGRVREATLRALPSFPGYLTLAAALIHSADWVDEVRHVAQITVERLLPLCDHEDLVALWPLVLRLQSRERVSPDWFRGCLENWMLREDSRPSLRTLIDSHRAAVRAWAIRSSLEAGIVLDIDLLDTAIHDADPRIGLQALRYLQRHQGDGTRLLRLAESGLQASHPVVRRESLQILSDLEGGLTRRQLLVLLSDASAGVRSRAAFILRNQFAEDPTQHWRALVNGGGPLAPNAVASLADHALPQDEALMRHWLRAPGGLIRAQALRGLVKAGGQVDDAEFSALLELGGNRLLRPLGRLVNAGLIPLDVDRVSTILASPSLTPRALDNLREALKSLGHWQRLQLLLRLHANGAIAQAGWNDAISDWVEDSGRYAPLSHNTRDSLLQLLEERREQLRSAWHAAIRAAIERH